MSNTKILLNPMPFNNIAGDVILIQSETTEITMILLRHSSLYTGTLPNIYNEWFENKQDGLYIATPSSTIKLLLGIGI